MTAIQFINQMPAGRYRFWTFKNVTEAESWAKEKGIDLTNAVWAEKQRALGILVKGDDNAHL